MKGGNVYVKKYRGKKKKVKQANMKTWVKKYITYIYVYDYIFKRRKRTLINIPEVNFHGSGEGQKTHFLAPSQIFS